MGGGRGRSFPEFFSKTAPLLFFRSKFCISPHVSDDSFKPLSCLTPEMKEKEGRDDDDDDINNIIFFFLRVFRERFAGLLCGSLEQKLTGGGREEGGGGKS